MFDLPLFQTKEYKDYARAVLAHVDEVAAEQQRVKLLDLAARVADLEKRLAEVQARLTEAEHGLRSAPKFPPPPPATTVPVPLQVLC